MKRNIFDSADLILLLSFFPVFRAICVSSGITGTAARRLFLYFMKNTAAAAPSTRLSFASVRLARRTDEAHERFGSNVKIANYLLTACATKDVIKENAKEISSLRQGLCTMAFDFEQTLHDRAL